MKKTILCKETLIERWLWLEQLAKEIKEDIKTLDAAIEELRMELEFCPEEGE